MGDGWFEDDDPAPAPAPLPRGNDPWAHRGPLPSDPDAREKEERRRETAERLADHVATRAKDWFIAKVLAEDGLDADAKWHWIERAHRAALAIPIVAEVAHLMMAELKNQRGLKRLAKQMGIGPDFQGADNDPDAPEPEPHDRAKRFMDQGTPDHGWKPSELFDVARGALRTSWLGDKGTSRLQARHKAEQFEHWAIETARDRWKRGFYADPFTNEPRRRPETECKA